MPLETPDFSKSKGRHLIWYFMVSGETIRVKFGVSKSMIGETVEVFGKDIVFLDEDQNGATATAYANEMSVEQFAKVYMPDVVILEAQKLADRVKNSMEQAMKQYEKHQKGGK